jgi:hypothetical protein
VVLGGTELISGTGLTVEINRTKYVEKIVRREASGRDGDEVVVVPSKMNKEPIYIVLEPVSLENGTLFLITRYLYSETDKKYKRKSQSLNVSLILSSGAALPSISRTSTVPTISSNVILASSAPSASPTLPT